MTPDLENYIFKTDAAAVDFETYYDKDYSIKTMGLYGYTHDPRFDAYLVVIYTKDFRFSGHPKDAPWDKIKGKVWVSQNQGFDGAVHDRIIELGVIADVRPSRWHCTANLCVYCNLPRNLKGAVQALYQETISKDLRDKDMKGRTWEQYGPELQEKVKLYALDDGFWCLRLWEDLSDEWPEHERRLSELTYVQGERGMYIDSDGVEQDVQLLERVKFEASLKIPWRNDYVMLSRVGLAIECRKVGIEPPASLAMDDEDCAAWEDKYGEQFPWVGAMRDYRRTNMLLEKFKTLKERIQPNGRMGYSLLYFGGHTGRWSGSGGFNMQNMPRDAFYFDDKHGLVNDENRIKEIKASLKGKGKPGWEWKPPGWLLGSAEMRSKFIAAPGKKLLIADYSQIEARVTPWLAGDMDTLAMIRSGFNVYEAHARLSMGWKGGKLKEENPRLYLLAKMRVLGLGFGCGHEKFLVIAFQQLDPVSFLQIFGAEVSPEDEKRYLDYQLAIQNRNDLTPMKWARWLAAWQRKSRTQQLNLMNSWLQVTDFRKKNPKIVELWKRLDRELKSSVGDTYEIQLPSGRWMRYFNVNDAEGSIQARTTRGGNFVFTYGGKLTENIVQATARDIFGLAKLRVAEEMPLVMDTHDEIIAEVDQDFPGQRLVDLMVTPPSWASSLPIGAELTESLIYLK